MRGEPGLSGARCRCPALLPARHCCPVCGVRAPVLVSGTGALSLSGARSWPEASRNAGDSVGSPVSVPGSPVFVLVGLPVFASKRV